MPHFSGLVALTATTSAELFSVNSNACLGQVFQRTSKHFIRNQGRVVQSIVSLTSSLRGQLVKCFKNFITNTLIFFVEK